MTGQHPRVVDADTHIAEGLSMWDKLDEAMHPRRPLLITAPRDTWYGGRNAFWLIDGKIVPKPAGKGGITLATPTAADAESRRTDITIGSRELTDVESRLADMDRLNVDVQIVYPTLFLGWITDDVELEVGLCHAYNRFVGEACSASKNRIRWVAIPPLRNIDETIKELRWSKEHGAVGVFFRGMEGNRTLDDPYFFPVYEEASALDLSICIHTGPGAPAFWELFDVGRSSGFPHRALPMFAFRNLVANHIPQQFPRLRFGFIESGCSWVPFVFHQLHRRSLRGLSENESFEQSIPRFFEENHLWVACEADEDLPYLLKYIGEDHMIIGSDYCHRDPTYEPDLIEAVTGQRDLSDRVMEKILGTNAAALYGV